MSGIDGEAERLDPGHKTRVAVERLFEAGLGLATIAEEGARSVRSGERANVDVALLAWARAVVSARKELGL